MIENELLYFKELLEDMAVYDSASPVDMSFWEMSEERSFSKLDEGGSAPDAEMLNVPYYPLVDLGSHESVGSEPEFSIDTANIARGEFADYFPYTLSEALNLTGISLETIFGKEESAAPAVSVAGIDRQGETKEIHIHNEVPSVNIEFSGSIQRDVDIDALLRTMTRRLKDEFASGSDFAYSI
ncbi:MAG: hypothetical protein Q4C00_04885 [Bacillota bacterium]|nr:hypothetical protein [Bacillota bacterium]